MSLGKHKYYCEMCQKQCKDENAFQQHKRTSFHQQNMIHFNEDPERFIQKYSTQVQEAFLELFRVKYGFTSFVPINRAYNEYIRDPYHTHLNATKWASLTEFAIDLERQGLAETTKEVDATGTEQVMLRLIDKDREKKESLAALKSKDSVRESERKREEKDLEKMIKQANKMQQRVKGRQEEVKTTEECATAIQIAPITFASEESAYSKPAQKPRAFGMGGQISEADMLQLLQKNKKSNLDLVLEHAQYKGSGPSDKRVNLSQQQNSIAKSEHHQWLRPRLIVKITQEGAFKQQKGEVIKLFDNGSALIKLQTEKQDKIFHESDVAKVIPSEGGRVFVFSLNNLATLQSFDLKTGLAKVTVQDASGSKQSHSVKFNDICKVNQ